MGGHSQKAPQAYQPASQPQADAGYQNLVNSATPWATGLPGQVIPGMNTAATNIGNNPYNAGALAGAQGVSNLAIGGVAPNMVNASQGMYGLGDTAAGAANPMAQYGLSQLPTAQAGLSQLPMAMSGANHADPLFMAGMNHANKIWSQTQQFLPTVTGGMDQASQLLNGAFDPQQQLYDRNYQQMSDQTNAINSMYGLGNSAYGAGVAGQNSRNFNIDWQNNQLGRQIAALGAYDTHTGQITSNFTGLQNTAGNQFNSLSQGAVSNLNNLYGGAIDRTNSVLNGSVDRTNSVLNGVTDRFNTGVGAAGNAYGAGAGQGIDALNTLGTATQLPSQTYNQQQAAYIQALSQLAQAGGASLAPTNPLVSAEGNYLQIGQGATQLNQNAAQINNAAQAAQMQALMSGLGTIAGIAMAPGSGGMSLFSHASKASPMSDLTSSGGMDFGNMFVGG